jgi:hypothetical protein
LTIKEFRREKNRNYKQRSLAQLVATKLNARTLLLSRSGSRASMPNNIECNITNHIGGQNQCLNAMMARSFILYLVNELCNYDVVKKIFMHDIMKPLLQKHLANLVETKHNQTIVDSIKSGVSTHLGMGCTPIHAIAKDLLGTLTTSMQITSGRQVAKQLGQLSENLLTKVYIDDFWLMMVF